jgi:hypothetical protein
VEFVGRKDGHHHSACGKGHLFGKNSRKNPSGAEALIDFAAFDVRAKARTLHRVESFRNFGTAKAMPFQSIDFSASGQDAA